MEERECGAEPRPRIVALYMHVAVSTVRTVRTDKSMKPRRHRGAFRVTITSELDEGGRLTPRFGRFTPGRPGTYLYGRLGGPHGHSGRMRKISLHRHSIPGPSIS